MQREEKGNVMAPYELAVKACLALLRYESEQIAEGASFRIADSGFIVALELARDAVCTCDVDNERGGEWDGIHLPSCGVSSGPDDVGAILATLTQPTRMLLWCPGCGERHVDRGVFAAKSHHTHACQSCGHVWRPAIGATIGVQFLPGFKDQE